MFEKLKVLLDNSYSPYSNIKFACIVETKKGNFYNGVNIENASFGATICAERNAINGAISNGDKEISALYLINNTENIMYPCNLCKQVFLEFLSEDVIFNIMNINGDMEVLTLKEILNKNFTKDEVL